MNFHGRINDRMLRMYNKGKKLDVLVEKTEESSLLGVANFYKHPEHVLSSDVTCNN